MEPVAHLDVISAAASGLIDSAAVAGVDATVPTCPGWMVRDLVLHVGRVHRWVATMVASGATTRADFPPAPEDAAQDELLAWAREASAELVDTLRRADPDGDVWTFGEPRSVRFWLRRMAQETSIHGWDAAQAAGSPIDLPGAVAADGIDEFGEMILPRVIRSIGDKWDGESIHLHRTDGEGEWLWTLGPGPEVKVERSHAKGALALRGSASDLLLWAANRHGVEPLEVFGDGAIAARWAETVHF
jgi:uncharacterized protein (TIGR03083 family)